MSTSRIQGQSYMARFLRDFDWAGTPLGPVSDWPAALVTLTNMALASPLPTQIFWGKDGLTLYNDALLAFIVDRHPGSLGKPVCEVWPEVWSVIGPQLDQVYQTGESISFEATPLKLLQNGKLEQMYWSYAYSALPNEDGTVAGVLNVAQNATAQKLAEEQLEMAKESAESANRAKSEFLANMSHELRTPLSAVIGYSELLEEELIDAGDEASIGDVRKIQSNARHLLALINDVLDLSKIEAERMTTFAEDFSVPELLNEVKTTMCGLVEQKGNQLVLEPAGDLGSMHTDVVKLRQCLFNLIGNAAKFTENGTITIRASRNAETLSFSVIDSGIGMTSEQIDHLFQRFSQADASTTRKFGGTGLGLAITRAFAKLLGGEINVTSTYGEGSNFTITIPAILPERPEGPMQEPQEHTEDKQLVLVVEDDAAQRDLMTRFLEREGFSVQLAPDGKTGVELARKLHPRAVLLDVMMPQMDGWTVLNAIKADPEIEHTPVVMVTFVNEPGLSEYLGAAETVLKPVKWEKLREVIEPFRHEPGDVLIVEDDPDTREVLRTILSRDGWTISEAKNGQEALDIVKLAPPKAVLLDLTMPVMDGFSFLAKLRQTKGLSDLPVIVYTASLLNREQEQQLKAANKVLIKGNTDIRQLSTEIRTAVQGTAEVTANSTGEATAETPE